MFSPDGTLISASAAPHCGAKRKERRTSLNKEEMGEGRLLGVEVTHGKERRKGRDKKVDGLIGVNWCGIQPRGGEMEVT